MKDTSVISFFFNARGGDLEKSTIGMYRSLLLQLLERLPVPQDVFGSLGSSTQTSGYPQWSVELLKSLIKEAVRSIGKSSMTCLIDALDECDERQIRDMISFFEHLGELAASAGIRFHVCFSSRHYPHVTIAKGLILVLEMQEGHCQDIVNYLDSELKIGRSQFAKQTRIDLQEKAAGIFMWVVLVVEILNKEYDDGNIHTLRRRLREIPGDLHELFRNTLMRDNRNRSQLLLCIQWVLFAREPLNPEQLYFAILSGTQPEAPSDWNSDEITAADIRRFILSSSKGLAEVTASSSPTVQFIHESVRDFLLKENGLEDIWPDLRGDFQGESHERLKQCCLNYVNIDISTSLNVPSSLPRPASKESKGLRQSASQKFPFLEYATRNVLYHADTAERGGISQLGFLQSFRLAGWITLNNLFETHEVRRYTSQASLLYILAERNMAALAKVCPSNRTYFAVEKERYGTPFFAALATGSQETVQVFIQVHLDAQPQGCPFHKLCKGFAENIIKFVKIDRGFTFAPTRGILSYVSEQEDGFAFFLASQAHMADRKCRNPMSYAAERGYETVIKILIAMEVDIESGDRSGLTALCYAAQQGHEAVGTAATREGR